jgi:nitronate monooxygenase
MDAALERMLNLLLESERAGVTVLDSLAAEVKHPELKELLFDAREQEQRNAIALERLVREGGGTPSAATGPFAAKVATIGNTRGRLALLIHGQEWVARKIEETLALAPESGPIREYLQKMANRHRHEVEWGRAELIRLMDSVE